MPHNGSMTRTRLISGVLAAAASAALLAGCTLVPGALSGQTAQPPGAIGSAEPTEPPSSPSGSVTPAPTPTPTNPADQYTLSSEGLGPLRVGEPIRSKQPFVTWNASYCGEGSGGWQQTSYKYTGDKYAPVDVWGGSKSTSPLNVIIVNSPQLHTKHGLHLGSTLAEAKELGAVEVEKSDGFGQGYSGWVIRGSVGELIMWVKDDKVGVLAVEHVNSTYHWFPWEGICE